MVILAPSNRVLIVASMKNLPPKKSLSGVLIGGSRSLLTSYEGHGQKLGCPQIADRNIFKDGNEGFKNPGEDLEVLRSSCKLQVVTINRVIVEQYYQAHPFIIVTYCWFLGSVVTCDVFPNCSKLILRLTLQQFHY